ncbi:hypothetical protein, partial [Corallococcus sp. AB018]|uniref:hypothetical protein n=1 Tax=Corallococcus sp. AB018 TaxID=2316715 RepID=UPI00131578CD
RLERFRDARPLRLLHLLRHARQRPPRAATPAIPHGTSLAGRLLLYAKLKEFKKSEQHYETFVTLTPDGYPKRDRVIEILKNNSP